MGMYTGLRCKVIIKDQYRALIEKMMSERLDWKELDSGLDFIEVFSRGFRANFIPYGSLSYMPDEWEDTPKKEDGSYDWIDATATDGFNREFNKETGYWSFQCSLKNYENDIEKFMDLILENIAEKIVHLEKYYEEQVYSERYDFIDGKIKCIDTMFNKYGYDESDEPNYIWR